MAKLYRLASTDGKLKHKACGLFIDNTDNATLEGIGIGTVGFFLSIIGIEITIIYIGLFLT